MDVVRHGLRRTWFSLSIHSPTLAEESWAQLLGDWRGERTGAWEEHCRDDARL